MTAVDSERLNLLLTERDRLITSLTEAVDLLMEWQADRIRPDDLRRLQR